MNIPPELKYTQNEEWIRVEGKIGTVGITDFAQEQLSDIVFVEINASERNHIRDYHLTVSHGLEEGTFNSSFKDVVMVVKGKKSSDMLEDISIYDNRKKDEPKVLMAKHGKFFAQESGDVGLYLTDGYINIMRGTMTTELYFEKYNMILSLEGASAAPKKMEFTPSQLLAQSKTAETYKRKVAFYLELHRRFSLPAVCLLLAFIGPPLALASGKSGKLGGLALGLFVFTLYYTVLIYGESLVNAGKMPHYLGAWLATTLMGIFSWIMFRKESL